MNSLLQKNLISTKEASALSGYNADYLSRLCREKKIASSQVGRTWLIERASLEVFMETQLDRKIELAENLARERELEYRKANSPVTQVSGVANDLENRMRVATQSMLGAFSSVRIPRSMPVMSGRAFAAGLTAFVLGASVTLAGSGVVARAGEMILASAFEVRALAIAAVYTSNSLAVEKTAEFSRIAEDEIKKIEIALVRATDTRVATLPLTLGEAMKNSHEPVEMTKLANVHAREIFETYPEPLTFTQIVAGITHAATHPEEILATTAREAMLAYNRLGVNALNDIQTVLALHLRGVEAAANGLVSVSLNTRDIAVRTPLAIGNVFVTASSAVLSSYERAVYAYVENIDVVPGAITGTVYGIGNYIGGTVAMGVQSAPVVYEESVLAFVEESVSAGLMISEGSFAFGKEADRTVWGLLEAQDRAVVQSVERARLAVRSIENGVAHAVLAIESVPLVATDKTLGVVGGIALRIESVDTSMLSASPLASFDIDRFVPEFLRNVTAVFAHAVGSAFHGIFGPLAGFFGASEEVGLAVIPNDPSSFPVPSGTTGTEEAVKGNTTVYTGPVTIVRNEYPTVTYGGVPQSYVDERFDFLRRTLYNRIEDVSNNYTFSGEIMNSSIVDTRISDSTFEDGAITNSTFTGGSITGSSLNVASTTITGSLTVNGDIVANGIVSTSSTSTNATSTNLFATNASFTNLLGENATITNATTTNFYAAVASVVDGFFTNLTATLATITNAVITNLTATDAVFTNATSTNATSTNLFTTNGTVENLLGTNATITNATSTTFYATLATIFDGFFTNLTATLANITTAVIANLTATDAVFTNATSTNATSTNLFATNLTATNATSTNLFATGARFTTAVIDALTSPLANITTAIITNLTATNSTLTNATSTNAFALTYVTPSRLLSVGANGVATSTSLSSWVTGTLNQLTVTDNGIGGVTLSLPSTIVIGSSQPTTIASNGATSTFGGGIQATFIEGGQYVAGPYILATSTTATSAFSGNIAVGRNTTLGTSAADLLTVNSTISSSLIPTTNNTYDFGSTGSYWRRGYIDELTVNNLSAASTSIAGTVSSSFTLNADNATADTEDSTLIFNRGSASPHALLTWNSTLDRFEFNMPVFSANSVFTSATTTNFTTTNFTLNSNLFTSLLGTGLSNIGGALTVNYSDLATDFFRQGGNSFGATAVLGTNDSNNLAFETNNATRMTIDTSGNIGIGTTNPGAKLEVVNSTLSSVIQRLVGNNNYNLDITSETNSDAVNGNRFKFAIGSAGGEYLFSTSGGDRMIINSLGNVGIGTTSPSSPLNIVGNGGIRGNTAEFNSNIGSGSTVMNQLNITNTTGYGLVVGFNGSGITPSGYHAVNGAHIVNVQNGPLTFGTNNVAQVTILGSGNVGIGTTSPSSLLHVAGATGSTLNYILEPSGWSGMKHRFGVQYSGDTPVLSNNALLTSATAGTLDNTAQTGSALILGASGSLNYVQASAGSGSRTFTSALYINSAGNIGIGTTVFVGDERLNVNGRIRAGTFQGFNVGGATFYGAEPTGTTASLLLHQAGVASVILGSKPNDSNLYLTNDYGAAGLGNAATSLTITSAGNVGIGTATPSLGKLQVVGSASTPAIYAELAGVANNIILQTGVTGGNGTFGWKLMQDELTTGDLFLKRRLSSVDSDVMYFQRATGNVGIGTTGPTTKLHVATNGVAQAQIQNTSGTTKNAQLLFTDNGGTGWRIGSDVSTNNNTDNFQIYKDSLAAAVLTINSSGNVGIGTTTPADKLDVFGGVLITGNDARLRLQRTTGPNYVDFNSSNQFRVRSIALNDTGDTYPFTIDTTGYVGINTTSPLARMHIIGGNNTSLTLDRTASPAAQRFRMFVGDGTGGTIADENYIVSANTGLHFWGGGSGTTEYVTFRDNGNVGIGNTNPIYVGLGVNTNPVLSVLGPIQGGSATRSAAALGATTAFFDVNGWWGMRAGTDNSFNIDVYNAANPIAALTVLQDGNVGIGTANAPSRLTVAGNIETTNGADRSLILRSSTNYNYELRAAGDHFQILEAGDAAKVRFHISYPNGNVGIGTTAPGSRLHVSGGGMIVNTVGGVGTSIGRHINLGSVASPTDWRPYSGSTTGAIQMENSATEGFLLVATQGAAVPRTQFITTGGFEINVGATIGGGAGTSAIHILSSGNVGIGNSAPTGKLTVADAGSVTPNLIIERTIGGADALRLTTTFSGGNAVALNPFITGADNGGFEITLAGTQRLVITPAGNVSIGGTSAAEKLSVTGNILSSNLAGSGNRCVYADLNGVLRVSSGDCGLASATGDNLGNHIATQNIQLNGNWLSGDGGSEGIFVNAAGNVGLGDTTPDAKLEILQGSDTSAQGLQITRSNDTDYTRLYMAAGLGSLSDPLIFNTAFAGDVAAIGRDGSAYFAGNVGVGTTNPAGRLHASTLNDGAESIPLYLSNSANTTGTSVSLGFNAHSTNSLLTGKISNLIVGPDNYHLAFYTYGGGLTEKMRITQTGNVGIGTATPAHKLTVTGGHLAVESGGVYVASGNLMSFNYGVDNAYYVAKVGSNLSLNTGGAFTFMGGNVGIGTTSPSYLLTNVSGTAPSGAATDAFYWSTTQNDWAAVISNRAAAGGAYGLRLHSEGVASTDFPLMISSGTSPGTVRVAVTGEGNVGIGTTSPGALLQVGSAAARGFRVYGNNSPYGVALAGDTGGWAYGYNFEGNAGAALGGFQAFGDNNTLSSYYVGTYANQRITILSGGNVGIGTTDPGSALEVKRTASNAGIYANYNDTNKIRFEAASNGNSYFGITTGSGSLSIGNTNNADAIFLTSSGRVGIGTTGPDELLHVGKTGSDAVIKVSASVAGAYFVADSATTGFYGLQLRAASTPKWMIGDYSGGSNLQFIQGTITNTPKMTLDTNGNLGIGSLSPGLKLEVVSGVVPAYDAYTRAGAAVFVSPTVNATNSGTAPNAAENVLTLVRPGVTGDVYPSVAELRIAKTTTGIQASTRLDFRLLDTGASTFGTPLSLLSNGNVGIGTTEPEGKFHVLGGTAGTVTAHGNANLGVFEGNGSNGISILVPNGSLSKIQFGSPADNIGGLIQYQQSTKTMRIGAGSDTAGGITQLIYDQGQVGFTLSAAGNVGIGTTTPVGKLSVTGGGTGTGINFQTANSSNSPLFTIQDNGNVTVGAGSAISTVIKFGVKLATNQHVAMYNNGGQTTLAGLNDAGSLAGLRIEGSNLALGGAGGTTHLTISSTGNVGIGTSDTGFGKLTILQNTNGPLRLWMRNEDAGSSATAGIVFNASGNSWQVGMGSAANNSNALAFIVDVSGTPTERMRITTGGFVGIGTVNPGAKLEVANGNIRLSGTGDAYIDSVDMSATKRRGLSFSDNAATTFNLYAGGNSTYNSNTEGTTKFFFRTSGGGSIEKWIFNSAGAGDLMEIAAGGFTNGYARVFGRLYVDGNVGIGSTAPLGKLHVLTTAETAPNSISAFDARHTVFGPTTSDGLAFSKGTAGSAYISSIRPGVAWDPLAIQASTFAFNPGGGSSAFFITNSSNVGIGTVSPTAPLHVVYPFAKTDTTERAGLEISSNDGSGWFGLKIRGIGAASQANRTFTLQTHESGSSNSGNITLQPYGGRVGIGETNPGSKLTVVVNTGDGDGINVTNASNSSYVSLFVMGSTGHSISNWANSTVLEAVPASTGGLVLSSYTGKITFQTSNRSNRMTILENGNVGIGTTNPLAQLAVGGTQAGNAGFEIVPGSGIVAQAYNRTGGAYASLNFDGSTIGFRPGGSTAMFIAGTGNVGIGMTDPAYQLEVGKTTGGVIAISTAGNAGSNASPLPATLNFLGYGDVVKGAISVQDRTGNFLGGWMKLQTADSSDVLQDRIFIDRDGNVGIGTTNPTHRLEVVNVTGAVGTNTIVGSFTKATTNGGGSASIRLTSDGYSTDIQTNSGGTGPFTYGTFVDTNIVNNFTDASGPYGNINFVTNGAVKMTITGGNASGNVGIGTASPGARLHVLGSDTLPVYVATSDANASYVRFFTGSTVSRGGFGYNTAGAVFLNAALSTANMVILNGGNVGIGTADASRRLTVVNDGSTNLVSSFQFGASGAITTVGADATQGRIQAYTNAYGSSATLLLNPDGGSVALPGTVSCTGLQTNGSGVISCASDENLKDIQGVFTTGLSGLRGINPQTYTWKEGTDYFDGGIQYSGFIAQNVGANIPEAMNEGVNGIKQISTTAILAASVNAIKELDIRTLALAPAAQNQAAHSLAVSTDASIAGKLTVTGIGTFSNSLTAASVFTQGSVTAVAFLTNSAVTLPSEVLTNGSADLFKMASYAITSMQALSERTDLLAVRIDEVETRLALLEASSATEQVSGAVGLTLATLKSMLQTLGIYLENGIAQFETLVFRQLAVAKDTNGDSSAGSQTILAGNTVVEVQNPYVLPTSKIFVTFTGPIQGAWYLSNKEAGKFRVTLAQGQSADVSFDYFILQTEGQLASPGAAGKTQTQSEPTPSPSTEPLPPVFPGEGTSTTTPVVSSGDTTPPSITLNGPAAREIDQGATWIDLGATASDETDGDLTASIQVQGTVDTSTPGTYTVTYSVSDAAGNQAHVSRIVSVKAVAAPAPEPTSTPEPAPAP